MIGIWEWIIIILITLITVWAVGKKYKEDAPTIARTAGKSLREFKEGLKEIPKELNEIKDEVKEGFKG